MFCRFRAPLKEAPVWNVLITSICKESESKTALLHSQREERKRKVGSGGQGWGQEGGAKGAESQRASPSDPEQQARVRLGGTLHLRNTLLWIFKHPAMTPCGLGWRGVQRDLVNLKELRPTTNG